VKEIESLAEFESEVVGPGLVVVDFFTTWCGPCKQIAPIIEQLVLKYPHVKFIKVDIEKNEDIARPRNIQSIPTFHFFVKGQLVDEMKGANPATLEEKINQHGVASNPFGGSGHKLASADADPNVPALSAREARLKAFASVEGPRKSAPATTAAAAAPPVAGAGAGAAEDCDEDEALSKAMALSMAGEGAGASAGDNKQPAVKSKAQQLEEAEYAAAAAEVDAAGGGEEGAQPEHFLEASGGQDWEEEMVPVPVNEDMLAQLVEMGFSDVRGRKALVHGGSVDGAMGWLAEHQDDADIDQPYLVRKADTIPKPPLTEEEKAERSLAIKAKIKERQAARAKQEKADEIRKEKERRERGQKIDTTLEERQRLQRKRDAEKAKKEKDAAHSERLRLRAEIARDKELRRANKGVLPSVLGVDGYNPSIIQYDQPGAASEGGGGEVPAKRASEATTAAPTAAAVAVAGKVPPAKKKSTTSSSSSAATEAVDPAQRVDSAVSTLLRYRTGGDGGQALKLLLTFVRNVAQNPDEPKYKSISTESNAFKSKLMPLVGPLMLLKAVGFQRGEGEDEGKLKLSGEVDSALLADTVTKLTNAHAMYLQQNPL